MPRSAERPLPREDREEDTLCFLLVVVLVVLFVAALVFLAKFNGAGPVFVFVAIVLVLSKS